MNALNIYKIRKSYQWLERVKFKRQHRGTDHSSIRKRLEASGLSKHGSTILDRIQGADYAEGPQRQSNIILAGCKMQAGTAYSKWHNHVAVFYICTMYEPKPR